ncbi:MAG: hypothetical protein NT046_09375 [Arenimonas sp.]|nr:hypothetical protein [Arenimonas sp.]
MVRLISLLVAAAMALSAGFFLFFRAQDETGAAAPPVSSTHATADKARPVNEGPRPGGSHSAASLRSPFLLPTASELSGNGLEIISRYRQDALQGDGEAAYAIFRVLTECEQRILAQPGLETGIDCAGITPEQMGESLQFLRIAADSGVLQAQLSYVSFASAQFQTVADIARNTDEFESFKADSMRYLSSAARSGSVEGLLAMSDAHRQGLLTAQSDLQAFAYLHAVSRSGLASSANPALARLGARLSQQELRQATLLGDRLYRQCCN